MNKDLYCDLRRPRTATTPPSGSMLSRGYIPDARGITYRNCFVEEGDTVVLDDDLVMHFTKQLAGA